MTTMPEPGPYETRDQVWEALRGVRADARGGLQAAGYAILNAACASAGVRAGDYDRQVMNHYAGVELEMCAVFAGLIIRAHEAGKASATAGGVTEWALSYAHRPVVPGVKARRVIQPYPDEATAREAVAAVLADAPEDEPLLMRRGPWTEAPTGGGGD